MRFCVSAIVENLNKDTFTNFFLREKTNEAVQLCIEKNIQNTYVELLSNDDNNDHMIITNNDIFSFLYGIKFGKKK